MLRTSKFRGILTAIRNYRFLKFHEQFKPPVTNEWNSDISSFNHHVINPYYLPAYLFLAFCAVYDKYFFISQNLRDFEISLSQQILEFNTRLKFLLASVLLHACPLLCNICRLVYYKGYVRNRHSLVHFYQFLHLYSLR